MASLPAVFAAAFSTAFGGGCCLGRRSLRPIRAAASASTADDLVGCALMHHTSAAIIPPPPAWPAIQAARTLVRDRGLWRWPPHANLLYPFVAPRLFGVAAPVLAGALSSVPPFEVELRELRLFVHSPRSATLWLHPEPSRPGALVDLEDALQAALPHADAQTEGHGGVFTAHFTVGHFEGEAAALSARDAILASGWEGVRFSVREVCLMARDGPDGQFEPAYWVPLGAGSALPRSAAPGERFAGMPEERPEFTIAQKRPKRSKKPRPAPGAASRPPARPGRSPAVPAARDGSTDP